MAWARLQAASAMTGDAFVHFHGASRKRNPPQRVVARGHGEKVLQRQATHAGLCSALQSACNLRGTDVTTLPALLQVQSNGWCNNTLRIPSPEHHCIQSLTTLPCAKLNFLKEL